MNVEKKNDSNKGSITRLIDYSQTERGSNSIITWIVVLIVVIAVTLWTLINIGFDIKSVDWPTYFANTGFITTVCWILRFQFANRSKVINRTSDWYREQIIKLSKNRSYLDNNSEHERFNRYLDKLNELRRKEAYIEYLSLQIALLETGNKVDKNLQGKDLYQLKSDVIRGIHTNYVIKYHKITKSEIFAGANAFKDYSTSLEDTSTKDFTSKNVKSNIVFFILGLAVALFTGKLVLEANWFLLLFMFMMIMIAIIFSSIQMTQYEKTITNAKVQVRVDISDEYFEYKEDTDNVKKETV